MKKQIVLIFSIVCIIKIGFSQSIVYDLMRYRPNYGDTINAIDSSFRACDSTWRTNVEWGVCLGAHRDMWNKYMNQTYDTLMGLLDSAGQSLLKQSQEYWSKSNKAEDQFSNYIIFDLGDNFFGREGYFERLYSDMAEIRARAMELKSCLVVIREINKEPEWQKHSNKSK